MDNKMIQSVIDKILAQKFYEIDIIKEQIKNAKVSSIEIYGNNKYIVFEINDNSLKKTMTTILSIMFLDKTNNIPIDCILFFKDGYVESLEIYSCDGQLFETIDINNIEIKMIDQEQG